MKNSTLNMNSPKSIILKSGAEYLGVMGGLVYFNDPKSGSTLGISLGKVTLKAVREKMAESRRLFK